MMYTSFDLETQRRRTPLPRERKRYVNQLDDPNWQDPELVIVGGLERLPR